MSNDRLIVRALRRETIERTPVWLMRQAGRYLPEYRELRKQAGGFLEMVRRPELAAEVTIQPVRRFGMDGAILFSDILIPLEAMGMPLIFDQRGPVLPEPIRTKAQVEALSNPDPAESMPYVGEALRLVRKGLPDETALLGFVGAPFTLATYAIEGGSSKAFLEVHRMMRREPEVLHALLDSFADQVGRHLNYQMDCGAEAVQIFDTWAGILSLEDYETFARPYTQKALDAAKGRAPRIAYINGGGHLFASQAAMDVECMGVDHRMDLADTFGRFGDGKALQGNLDPSRLLGSPKEVHERTLKLLRSVQQEPGQARKGHVLNLGHGVFKITDPDCVGAFVQASRDAAQAN